MKIIKHLRIDTMTEEQKQEVLQMILSHRFINGGDYNWQVFKSMQNKKYRIHKKLKSGHKANFDALASTGFSHRFIEYTKENGTTYIDYIVGQSYHDEMIQMGAILADIKYY
jgi:hypothetical protein